MVPKVLSIESKLSAMAYKTLQLLTLFPSSVSISYSGPTLTQHHCHPKPHLVPRMCHALFALASEDMVPSTWNTWLSSSLNINLTVFIKPSPNHL